MYELLWIRELTLVMGGTTHAVSTVVAAFMAGLALGSFLAGRRASRVASPLRAYGILEIAVAALFLLLPTARMGATLPLLIDFGVRRNARLGRVTG